MLAMSSTVELIFLPMFRVGANVFSDMPSLPTTDDVVVKA